MKMDLQHMNKDMLIKLIQTCRQDLEEELKRRDEIIERCKNKDYFGRICREAGCLEVSVEHTKCCTCGKFHCQKHLFRYGHVNGGNMLLCALCGESYKAYGWYKND